MESEAHEREAAPVAGAEYPLIAEGERVLLCTGARTYRHAGLPDSPWKCELKFVDGFGEFEVYGFLHLGCREKPHAGRTSRYWAAWHCANGGPPHKRQVMSARIFRGKWFRVAIETVNAKGRGAKRVPLPEYLHYSIVREILALDH